MSQNVTPLSCTFLKDLKSAGPHDSPFLLTLDTVWMNMCAGRASKAGLLCSESITMIVVFAQRCFQCSCPS